jgi:hypothetical protein
MRHMLFLRTDRSSALKGAVGVRQNKTTEDRKRDVRGYGGRDDDDFSSSFFTYK